MRAQRKVTESVAQVAEDDKPSVAADKRPNLNALLTRKEKSSTKAATLKTPPKKRQKSPEQHWTDKLYKRAKAAVSDIVEEMMRPEIEINFDEIEWL